MNPEDQGFAFRFVCKDFEIEVRGDERFVDKILSRYENRVMLKLKELLGNLPAPEPRRPEPPHPPHPPLAAALPARPPEAAPPPPSGEKKSRRHRGRGRRGKRHQENVEAGGTRPEPEPKPFAQTPLLRGGVAAAEAGVPRLPFSDPVAAGESAEPAFTPPPLGDVRPAATDFPSRRRTPKVGANELQALLEQRRPRTHHDRIMLMGYHLENSAGGSDFTAEELMECYRAAGETPPANLTQVLNHATRSGFMLRHDQGRTQRFKLSARGRRYVEDGLKLL